MNQLTVVVFFACVAALLASPLEPKAAAAQASQDRLKAAHHKCQSNPATAVEESALKALTSGGPKPANYGAHALCMSKALGWQSEDGSVNTETIKARAENIFGPSPKLNEIVNECAQNQANAEETAVHLTRCYVKYAPRHNGHPPGHPH
uniref:Pheromone binding protein 4 n=1 Tax=Cyrtotrachelus buqueti TaxID=1892066 RepID=A0A1L3KPU3_9CUCU|nr:pheromone binding protein 4 [Cyrtotrachelus buqueti]